MFVNFPYYNSCWSFLILSYAGDPHSHTVEYYCHKSQVFELLTSFLLFILSEFLSHFTQSQDKILVAFMFMPLIWAPQLISMYTSNCQSILSAQTGNRDPRYFRGRSLSIPQFRFVVPEVFSIFVKSNLSFPFLKPKILVSTMTFHFPSQPISSPSP